MYRVGCFSQASEPKPAPPPLRLRVQGYGAYPPVTWPEVLVWIFCMITCAIMFAFFNGNEGRAL